MGGGQAVSPAGKSMEIVVNSFEELQRRVPAGK
jgi:hypothetical protein